MRKMVKKLFALVMMMICSMTLILPACATELPEVTVPVTVSLTGTLPESAEDFTIVMKADNADFPMPEGAVDGSYSVTITGEGTGKFPAMTYDRVGIYTYTVYQIAGINEKCTYDASMYDLKVTISNKEDNSGLEATAVLYLNSEGDKKLPEVEFKNQYVWEEGTIEVTKRIFMMQGEEKVVLEGLDNVYYVGLFLDEEGTTPYPGTTIQAIEMKGSSVTTVKFTDLMEGTYYVFETLEDGTAIKPGEKREDDFFVFTSQFSTEQKVVIDQSLGQTEGKVILDNVYEDLPDGYLTEGLIKVKKSVFQGNDRVTVDDTFYAGTFTKVDGEYVLNEVKELKQNGTVEFTVMLAGENEIKSVKYWVFETDKDGNRIDKGTFPYEVSGEGVVTVSADELEQKLEIVNKIIEPETEPPTETETETETEKEVVETGDETPVEAYIMLTIAAVLVLVVGLVRRRRTK